MATLTACQTPSTSAVNSSQATVNATQSVQQNYSVIEKRITLPNGQSIYGKLYQPKHIQGKVPLVIFAHELGGTHENMAGYAEALAKKGIAGYVFDFRGGSVKSQSSGKTTEMSVMTEVADMEAILAESKKWDFVNADKIVLVGGSQGGVVSAFTATRNANKIAGLVLFYPAFVIEDDVHNFAPSKADIPNEFTMRGWIKVGSRYFSDVYDIDFMKQIGGYPKPVLILHGNLDPHVPVKKSQLAQSSYPNAKLEIIAGAEHSFRNEPHFSQAVAYVEQYLKQNNLMK
ncbi:alpha/beta hydrolase family protein [Wielerella bovis]|uniref:alpha/beta hydrolase family protein n=1 Tax=Wielerella bovis TaxID=2917790 RepID=UPI0020195113|nr:alpha/beta fold hydrolase [Wielerella bovis]ULJ64127.1 alpha/beta fold hydrolase [Wielerella bovis]ULJ67958.1 alpha/beta fold hydrolase [Wielerella bovis]